MDNESKLSRRFFLKSTGLMALFTAMPSTVKAFYEDVKNFIVPQKKINSITLHINNKNYPIPADTRSTLLDILREQLQLTGTKKRLRSRTMWCLYSTY
jgi:Aerobic-type carbon monoxide dehydrogenase, small subunit CoxS/CutS homologs